MIRCALSIAAALAAAAGQHPQPPFRSRVDLVRLDVSVTRGGQPVRGLTARDFTIVDSGVPQRIDSVAAGDDLPVSVIMALDVSGSVAGQKMTHLVEAARALIASLRPDDRAALVTFSRAVNRRVGLTRDRAALDAGLAGVEANGPTAIRDAIWTALGLRPDDDSRSMVLVFTDGIDNASWLSVSQLLTAVRRAGAVVHSVAVGGAGAVSFGRTTRPPTFVEQLADVSGGRQWSASSPRELRELFTRAIDEMRARYLVTFYPQGTARAGWHELKVTANVRGEVRTRRGYFAGSDTP